MSKIKMYIEEDNGGRAVIITDGSRFYANACASDGFFGDVDIIDGTLMEIAKELSAEYGDIIPDFWEDAENEVSGWYFFPCGSLDELEEDSELIEVNAR